MKRTANIFPNISSFEALHAAWRGACRGKRFKREILEFNQHVEENLLELSRALREGTYRHGGYRVFTVCDSKKREIQAPAFRDRVVHHAFWNAVEPVFERTFIFDSYACRTGKGTHAAVLRLERFWRTLLLASSPERVFCLKCDVSRYFESIDHEILLDLLAQKIKDKQAVWLAGEITRSSEKKPGVGIPIGNLTSQLFANIYLNELDQFVKHRVRARFYLRYMDDFVILSNSKEELHRIKRDLGDFLREELRLRLHPRKANVFPTARGIDFLGYVLFPEYRRVRKSTLKRVRRKMKRAAAEVQSGELAEESFTQALESWRSYLEFARTWRLRRGLARGLSLPPEAAARFAPGASGGGVR